MPAKKTRVVEFYEAVEDGTGEVEFRTERLASIDAYRSMRGPGVKYVERTYKPVGRAKPVKFPPLPKRLKRKTART